MSTRLLLIGTRLLLLATGGVTNVNRMRGLFCFALLTQLHAPSTCANKHYYIHSTGYIHPTMPGIRVVIIAMSILPARSLQTFMNGHI